MPVSGSIYSPATTNSADQSYSSQTPTGIYLNQPQKSFECADDFVDSDSKVLSLKNPTLSAQTELENCKHWSTHGSESTRILIVKSKQEVWVSVFNWF